VRGKWGLPITNYPITTHQEEAVSVPKNIFLTGFMGCGKTKVGMGLARRLGRVFVDTDAMVEKKAGKRVSDIFDEEGEALFRRMEHACVVGAARRSNAVVALGGGAMTRSENRDAIREGIIIYLRAEAETLLERVSGNEERPLLAGLDRMGKLEKIRRVLREREPFYREAHVVVDTDGLSVEEVVERIVAEGRGQRPEIRDQKAEIRRQEEREG
jgi:shikimate kinase